MSQRSGSGKRKRQLIVAFRATLAESEALKQVAATWGLSVAEFCRQAVVGCVAAEQARGLDQS